MFGHRKLSAAQKARRWRERRELAKVLGWAMLGALGVFVFAFKAGQQP